jgi:uncharacterized protein YdeI (YjbR/CyaY-like superfamily)
MTLQEFCDIIGVNIQIMYYNNQEGRWSASIPAAEIKEPGSLLSTFENGKTPVEAYNKLTRRLQGETLVLNSGNKELRREYHVPKTLELGFPM